MNISGACGTAAQTAARWALYEQSLNFPCAWNTIDMATEFSFKIIIHTVIWLTFWCMEQHTSRWSHVWFTDNENSKYHLRKSDLRAACWSCKTWQVCRKCISITAGYFCLLCPTRDTALNHANKGSERKISEHAVSIFRQYDHSKKAWTSVLKKKTLFPVVWRSYRCGLPDKFPVTV